MITLRKLCYVAVFLIASPQVVTAKLEIQHWINDDGVPVYFVNLPDLPMVDIQLRFTNSGHAHEGQKYGLASMTASMLHQGASNMNVDEIAETFSGLGAHSGASASADSSHTQLRSLTEPKYFDKALETWIKVFSSPDFPQKQFERRRKNVLTNIQSKRQKPSAIASDAFKKATYGSHPYGHPGLGTEETISALTLDDLRHFYKKHYVTSNLIVTLVGAISRNQATNIIDRITDSLEIGEHTEDIPPAPELKQAMTIRIPFPSEQAHVRIGHSFIPTNHPDFYALHLGNNILGGTGFGSRLLEEIRVKRGLAYSARSSVSPLKSSGSFAVSFQTRLDQADQAINIAKKILTDFTTLGPTDEEVKAALDRIRGSQVFRTNSNGRILSTVSNIAFHKRSLDYLDRYIGEYEKEDRQSITAAYQKHLHLDKMVTVIVGGPAE